MKICNFRPLCCFALMMMVAIACSFVTPWLALGYVVLLAVGLCCLKVPRWFKIVAVVLTGATVISFVLTTTFNPNPYYRTYDADAGLRGVVLRYVEWYLGRFLSPDNAQILFAMMFGNKSGLPWVLKHDFSVAGIAHLLAVSGLHVMLLAGVLSTILRWCRVPQRAKLWVIAPILIFYAYLCGWQYAVLRAMIMYLVYVVARQFLRPVDSLSTMAMAAVMIMLLFPYSLTSASFWLSFACVFGIDVVYRRLYQYFPVKAVAMYIAVTLGSLPFMIFYFGYLPVLGLVANVILVPLLVFAFYLGMFAVGTFICGVVLWLAEPILTFATAVCSALAAVPFNVILLNSTWPPIILYLLGLWVMSRYVFLRPRIKYLVAALLFTCYFVLIVV